MKLQASTIIESITATVILAIVFSIGMMVFGSMLDVYPAPQHIKAKLVLEELSQQTKTRQNFIDEIILQKGFRVEKTVLPYRDYKNIYQLTLTAFDHKEKVISSINELIYTTE